MLDKKTLGVLKDAIDALDAGFDQLPAFTPAADTDALHEVLIATAERLKDNYPYPHPLYAGQMLKPPHPVARLAYALAMTLNPNNHALDGGRASSAMEKEAVAELARLVGWDRHLGHLCGGGTLANLEALWVAGRLHPGRSVIASEHAHYTHHRISEVLGLTFRRVDADAYARMDILTLESLLRKDAVGTVVVTVGTTAYGSIDPLPDILALRRRFPFRLHIDAAYGGYFSLAEELSTETRHVFDCIAEADSIVIDPHKHGLQPYGCGCVLFRDPEIGRFYQHESPYNYFSSDELHLGEISLECSRPGASAVALWATQRLLPLTRGGSFARELGKSLLAARELHRRLENDARFQTLFEPELDIVVWWPRAPTAAEISNRSRRLFEAVAGHDLHLAVVDVPRGLAERREPGVDWDQTHIVCLRSCLMKPEHLDWIDAIWHALDQGAKDLGL